MSARRTGAPFSGGDARARAALAGRASPPALPSPPGAVIPGSSCRAVLGGLFRNLEEAHRRADVKAIVVTGAGQNFR